jgi:hypothetical protein
LNATELGLPLGQAAPERRATSRWPALGAAGKELCGWLPVLGLFAVFLQLCWLGLRPALSESERLRGAEHTVAAREERLAERNEHLLRELRALSDPVFEERVRRARRSQAYAAPPRPLDLPLSDAR